VAAIAVMAVVGSLVFVLKARSDNKVANAAAPAVNIDKDLAAVLRQDHIVFRNTALGNGYGQVAAASLAAPGGARAITPATCDRVYAGSTTAICLKANRGVVTTYASSVLGPNWQPLRDLPLTGLPSRARLSPDGTLVATTTFVYGDSYATAGQFSTRTIVSRVDGSSNVDLEQFQLTINGQPNNATDRNLWGVTFVDSDRFYATAATGGKTWLVQGSLKSRTLTALHNDVECPSLSPDGKRIAFKKHGNLAAGRWRLSVLDLATGVVTELAETRSVDDQAVWLDNDRVIYGLSRSTAGTASSDVWVVPANGSGAPQLLVADAWSPSVVRVH
jgi:hypothetical protein